LDRTTARRYVECLDAVASGVIEANLAAHVRALTRAA
jgi:hypothetical protein